MRARKSALFLVKSSTKGMRSKGAAFRTGEKIPKNGIYRVIHRKHRLPHEVTLLRDEEFPKCAQCQDSVTFELVYGVDSTDVQHELSTRIRLYELPVLDEEEAQEMAG